MQWKVWCGIAVPLFALVLGCQNGEKSSGETPILDVEAGLAGHVFLGVEVVADGGAGVVVEEVIPTSPCGVAGLLSLIHI